MAGEEGLEPTTRGFGDRCSTIGATLLLETQSSADLAFFVRGVFAAARAELRKLQFILLLTTVLRRDVVALAAHGALE